MIKDSFPRVTGHVTLKLKKDGEVVRTVEGKNIWTNTGRQYLADLIRYSNYSSSTKVRDDRIAYFGVGTGTQTSSVGITSLVTPVAFDALNGADKFLALIDSSTQSAESTYTSVTFEREFATDELVDSSGNPLVLREVGLFTNGDEGNSYAIGIESINGINGDTPGFAPMAYKTFEPITKTQDYTLTITWQVRFS